ncbi:Regulation of nuclear pre-mRNA domain-containing protein 2-like protein [Dinothrombium tinctorium]|uniref:Regulation of nuclear pre-mRNA domain-containing protein 2 n=1 Tax=Dinothrombium tinctorium TaxID=1965070 RepID=A0A3S3NTP1_9ACAR|nr:Regulation of nuclear pre-mRNA domain-containing protein 2-like protein [Dinothrombium tinctorium]
MALDENNLEKKLENVSNSQDSIQSLSLWILHHKNHNKRIVQIWLKALKKGKVNHRLTLFYLANDVIQHAKRKNINVYLEEFGEVLKEATELVKEDRIKSSVCRVFNIWQERSVYPSDFIEQLKAILTGNGSVNSGNTSKIVAEFKLTPLVEKIKKLKKLESYANSKIESINCNKLDALSCEVLNHLKDKSHGEQFSKDFDEAAKHLEAVVHALEKEISARNELIDILEKSEIFYEIQKEEAKIVANAYKNFAIRVKSVKKKLEGSKKSLPSPLPSPSVDAPSPTNSDDGPVLPGMESSMSDIKAIMDAFTDSSSNNGQISSLDKRLSNLMQNMPLVQNETNNSDYSSKQSNVQLSSALQHLPQIQNVDSWNVHNQGMGLASQDLYSHMTPFDYDYCHPVAPLNDAFTNDANRGIQPQPIQAVISSRSDNANETVDMSSIQPYDEYTNIGVQQAPENFEPADMDLGNSDDEENGIRSQNHQRVLKVIETRRENVSSHYSSDQKVNQANNDSFYSRPSIHQADLDDNLSPSITHLKNSSRLPQRPHSSHTDERHRWRNVRHSGPAPAHHIYDSNQHHNQQHRPWKQAVRNPYNRGYNRRH